MRPWWESDNGRTHLWLYCGHVLDVLRDLPAESIHTVVTSPPYWGLRDYGLGPMVWGGDPGCTHAWHERRWYTEQSAAVSDGSAEAFSEPGEENAERLKRARWRQDATCARCGVWRGSLGLEPTPDLYVQHLVEVFREVRRVLREDGTLWLNMGDSYASGEVGRHDMRQDPAENPKSIPKWYGSSRQQTRLETGVKPKDLLGMPWRVAFALQADGWYLRSDIIWSKPNPMPESVTDRPTKAHEYLFLLAKSERYYYDADAIREPLLIPNRSGTNPRYMELAQLNGRDRGRQDDTPIESNPAGRNKRTVWEIPTQPYPEAHFATFPEALVEPCVLAGCQEGGTVLDPFAGSGTALLVAQRLGRHGIGIDLSELYCQLARSRIEPIHAQMQLDLFR